MKKIILSLVFIMMLISCGGGSAGGEATAPQVGGSKHTLKIRTLVYTGGGITAAPANELIEITVGETKLAKIPLENLIKGIPLPKDSLITIQASRINYEETEYEEHGILWLGYSEDEDEARNSEIEIEMNSDKQFTLVVSDKPDVPIAMANATLEINSGYNKDGEAGRIEGVAVEIDGTVYTDEFYSLLFVKGQYPVFKAILPENNPDIEFAGFNINGESREELTITDVEMKDNKKNTISARFIDKTSVGISVSIVDLNNRGQVKIGNHLIPETDVSYKLEDQQIGTKIQLEATPKENFIFLGWVINGANVSSSTTYTYIVENQNAEIKPIFSPANGSLTLTIYPRTNYGGYAPNKVAFEYKKTDGKLVRSTGYTDTTSGVADETIGDLTWYNSEITEIHSGTKVKLKAIPTTGFYPSGTGDKVKWGVEGSTTTTGFTQEISIENKSKSETVNFEQENRTVTIELNRLLYNGTAWIPETNSTFDAKGYSIKLTEHASNTTFTANDVSSASKNYKWGEVLTLEVNAGTHYAVDSKNGKNVATTPSYKTTPFTDDYYHHDEHEKGNPTNFIYIDGATPVKGGKGASVDGANQKFTMTFRVEDEGDNATNIVSLKHRIVEMNLYTSGGMLDNSLPEDSTATEYKSIVKVTNTGNKDQDNDIMSASTYSVDDTLKISSAKKKNILSGITTPVYAVAKLGSTFVKFEPSVSGALTSTPTLTNGTVKYSAIGNTGIEGITSTPTTFNLVAYFKSPIYTPWVQLRPTVDGVKLEDPKTDVTTSYSYTRTTDTGGRSGDASDKNEGTPTGNGKIYTKKSTQLKVRHGIPFIIKVDGKEHYDVISIDGKTEVPDNTLTITETNVRTNDDIYIVLKHRVRKVKLNIFGGREDRDTSVSKVIVSNTGVPASDKTYLAEYRNVSLATNADGKFISNKAVTHELEMLSGIDNGRVTITAITSKVHNFHKITGNTNLEASVPQVKVTAPASLKRGTGTYSTANTYTVDKIPENDTGEINVYFRVNSYKGHNNGLKYGGVIGGDSDEDHNDSYDFFYSKPDQPPKVKGNIVEVYSAAQLVEARGSDDYSGKSVHLMNDIYFGYNPDFGGINLKGALYGNENVIFDVDINGRAFIHYLNGGYINGLTVSRGYIRNYYNENDVGLIGTVLGGTAKFVTNAGVTVGKWGEGIHVGGVVGHITGAATLEHLGNYGTVYGRSQVGGVIGTLDGGAGRNYTYLFNRGSVYGQSKGSEGSRTGGVIGYMGESDVSISKVYNAGYVNGGSAENSPAGGIVGVMAWSRGTGGSGTIYIHDFYNTGKVDGGSGLAGVVVGCREVISGATDNNRETFPFNRGYNIGSFSDQASITWAGHIANGGGHWIKIHDVLFHDLDGKALNTGLGYAKGWLDNRLDGSGSAHRVDYFTQHTDAVPYRRANGEQKLGEADVKHLILPTDRKVDHLRAFKDSQNWEDSSGLPDVNGFTSRPTLKNLSEKVLLPDWILKPYQD